MCLQQRHRMPVSRGKWLGIPKLFIQEKEEVGVEHLPLIPSNSPSPPWILNCKQLFQDMWKKWKNKTKQKKTSRFLSVVQGKACLLMVLQNNTCWQIPCENSVLGIDITLPREFYFWVQLLKSKTIILPIKLVLISITISICLVWLGYELIFTRYEKY